MSIATEPAAADTSIPSFTERVAGFARSQGCTPFQPPDLTGTALRQREELVRWHGCATDPLDREWVHPGRTVIEVPGMTWSVTRPEECLDDSNRGIWFAADGRQVSDIEDPDAPDGIVLLCPQCGLDCT